MIDPGIIGIIIIVANFIFSYYGFTNQTFFNGYMFQVDRILINKDYKRLITSGFLHVSWLHLIFNMFSLLAFCGSIESDLGEFYFLVIYFASLIGGDLLALFVHRNHGDYSAVGASGAISGIIFSSIVLFPGMGIGFFGLPFFIPSWIYGIVYVLYTMYGIRSKKGNVGHEAHLGGALVGMLVALMIEPSAFAPNHFTILLITIPTIIFILMIALKPNILLVENLFKKKQDQFDNIDHKYNAAQKNKQKEIDDILDKISRKGMGSLTEREKAVLNAYSKSKGHRAP